ncbi:MAG: DUF4160 domain-containing protein [Tannerella sp.]|jgi:hypothetical protein|nr:DUF4160 domain-containing protein [Tannerella sp.]
MPTVINICGLRFFFYSKDHEPVHVHVENADGEAKFEVEDEIKLVYNRGLKPKDLRFAIKIVAENQELIKTEWTKNQ